ncbi:LOW QUALITY PROTEIN: hypothetical protein CFC21_089814 [Triticum aestivum]|uniref:F-box domain-containing protein n=2 Tax=Triticum aestivum TaxID=4565 RepID=A0A9R1IMJ0_WHEAT|nr:LOW QUALITY PROTEIN: hypothetical protein CFC21_089814 [Triticum aestivum]
MTAEPSLPSGFGTRPWLVQATPEERQTLTFVDSADGSSHMVIAPEMQGKTCLGCVHNGGWLLMLDDSTAECFLLRLTSDDSDDPAANKIPLPPLYEPVESILKCATLGTSPAHQDCAVVVAVAREMEDRVETFLLHCRPGASQVGAWLDAPGLTFPCLMIGHRGKIYFLESPDTLTVIGQDGDGMVQAQLMGSLCGGKEEHDRTVMYNILESCGDLFEVPHHFGDFSYEGTLTSITVSRLDLESMTWSMVDSIGGDRAFLVSERYGFSVPVCPGEGGLVQQGNCMYIVWSSCDCERLYKFCLDDNTISFRQILPQPTKPWCRAFWAVPPLPMSMVVKEIGLLEEEEEQATYCNTRPWHDLPLKLLQQVVSRLSLVDRIRFHAVCKSWRMVSNPVEQVNVWPWLLHCSGRTYFPILQRRLGGHVDQCRYRDMYIINPFNEDIVEMPILVRKYYFMGLSWSSADPTSPECVFFGIVSRHDGKKINILMWRHGEADWFERHFEYYEGDPFPVAYNNPVLFYDKFYCLGRPTLARLTWQATHGRSWRSDHHEGREFCYLIELRGELVSVFMRNADQPPRVFKLNEEEMAWMEVQEIGGAALFLDFRVSYSVASPEAGHGNRIYFPSYSEDGKQAAFYDIETKAYHPSLYGLKSPLQCVWVVPNLRPHIVSK